MYQQHFALKYIPFAKDNPELYIHQEFTTLQEQFNCLLQSPGIALLTGEPGVGKTAILNNIVKTLNPHQYSVIYLAETMFTCFDFYRQLASSLGLIPAHRFSMLWRDIKKHIRDRFENKHNLMVLIIDEAQNLHPDFFKSLPSFLNFDFDTKSMLTIWLVGHPLLANIIDRNVNNALASRIQFRFNIKPITDPQIFPKIIRQAFASAGCQSVLFSDSGIETIRLASQGKFRNIYRIIATTLQLAMQKNLNHCPDELILDAIASLKN